MTLVCVIVSTLRRSVGSVSVTDSVLWIVVVSPDANFTTSFSFIGSTPPKRSLVARVTVSERPSG